MTLIFARNVWTWHPVVIETQTKQAVFKSIRVFHCGDCANFYFSLLHSS